MKDLAVMLVLLQTAEETKHSMTVPSDPPLDTPMNVLKVAALNLGYGTLFKVKNQMIRPSMKWGLLPAKMFAVFS